MSQITRIFHSLQGQWKLQRMIPGHGKIDGTAQFQKSGSNQNTLHYKEDGLYRTFDGKNFKISREYYYHLRDEKISVFFIERPERLMHTLEFLDHDLTTRTVTAIATHLCNCDTYDAIYEFRLPAEFSLKYSVKGPKKDYTISTIFKSYINGKLI